MKIRLKPSTVCDGVGVFAIAPIYEGENIAPGSELIETERYTAEWLEAQPAYIKELVSDFVVRDEDGSFMLPIGGLCNMGVDWYLNHSADRPNVMTTDGGCTFLAIRDIDVGEELLIDYEAYDGPVKF